MNKILCITISYLLISGINPTLSAGAVLGSLFDHVQGLFGGRSGLSESEIVDGLKDALMVGTGKTVQALARVDGYYKNPKMKIPLPEPVQKYAKILRTAGFDAQLTQFELSMNRAAEQAAPEAGALFIDAIEQMTFVDAEEILYGTDSAATVYFQNKTRDSLQARLKPIIRQAMEEVGVTKSYQSVYKKVQSFPATGNRLVDLDSYVTGKAIDGLFLQLAGEEAKIRHEPAARVTDQLKKVFQ